MAKTTQNPLMEVVKLGQSLWYDGLIARTEFERMIREDGLRGATTNPVIFEKALAGDAAKLRELKDLSDEGIYQSLAIEAVREVADVFRPVYDRTQRHDGYVSIEVSPLLAFDTEATIREARELFKKVGRPNVMIKIPATAAGIPAIETAISEGINVNITLIFSVARYREVIHAYLSGLETRQAQGKSIKEIASVASFFVSRVDTAVDKILEEKTASAKDAAQKALFSQLLGKAAIANSKAAYAEFEELFAEERFRALKAQGAQLQRPLWASTGTKNPAYRDVLYVESLIGPNTVNTVPPPTLEAFRDHGRVSETLIEGLDEAKKTLEKLAFAGVALSEVTASLEKAGVELFNEAYLKIIARIKEKRA